jgi:hypothetical protein
MRLTGVDLVAVIGISTSSAQTILFEVGTELSLSSSRPVGGAIALGLRGLLGFYAGAARAGASEGGHRSSDGSHSLAKAL